MQQRVLLPEVSGTSSIIVAFHREQGVEVFAQSFDPAENSLYVGVNGPADPDGTIELLFYERSLDELGLEAGQQSLSNGAGRRIPRPEVAYSASMHDSSLGAWQRAETMSPQLEAVRLASTCPTVEVSAISVEANGLFQFLVRIGPDTALAGTDVGEAFLVRKTGLTSLSVEPASDNLMAAAVDDGGGLWVATRDVLHTATIDLDARALNLTPQHTGTSTMSWMDMGGEGSGVDGVLLENVGRIHRVLGGRRTELFDLRGDGTWLGGVARLAPEEAIIVYGQHPKLVRVIGDRVEEETVPTTAELTTAAEIPGLGARVGDADSRIYAQGEAGWELEMDLGGAHTITQLVPWDTGYVAVGLRPLVAFVRPDHPACVSEVPEIGRTRLAVAVDEGIFLLAHEPERQLRFVRLIER